MVPEVSEMPGEVWRLILDKTNNSKNPVLFAGVRTATDILSCYWSMPFIARA